MCFTAAGTRNVERKQRGGSFWVLLWMVACGMAGGLVSDCAADPGPLGCQANSDAAALQDLKSKGEQAPMVPTGELTQNALGIHTHTHTQMCACIYICIYIYMKTV